MKTPMTDEQVRALPLDHVRTRLREDIVTTPTGRSAGRRATAWTAGLAAAASVAALAVVPQLLGSDDTRSVAPSPAPAASGSVAPSTAAPSTPAPSTPAPPPLRSDRPLAALTTVPTGWALDRAELGGGPAYGVTYLRPVEVPSGEPSAHLFDLEWRRASERDQEVAEQSTQGGVRVGTIDVDGRIAPVWRLDDNPDGATGCTPPACVQSWSAVLPAEDGWFLTVMGAGVSVGGTLAEDEWRDLVSRVRVWPSGGDPADLPEALTTIDGLSRTEREGARMSP